MGSGLSDFHEWKNGTALVQTAQSVELVGVRGEEGQALAGWSPGGDKSGHPHFSSSFRSDQPTGPLSWKPTGPLSWIKWWVAFSTFQPNIQEARQTQGMKEKDFLGKPKKQKIVRKQIRDLGGGIKTNDQKE